MKSEQAEKPKVVIDTNTVISAPLSKDGNPAKIFELLLLEEINNFRSKEITNEVIDVFDREKIKRAIKFKKKEPIKEEKEDDIEEEKTTTTIVQQVNQLPYMTKVNGSVIIRLG